VAGSLVAGSLVAGAGALVAGAAGALVAGAAGLAAGWLPPAAADAMPPIPARTASTSTVLRTRWRLRGGVGVWSGLIWVVVVSDMVNPYSIGEPGNRQRAVARVARTPFGVSPLGNTAARRLWLR